VFVIVHQPPALPPISLPPKEKDMKIKILKGGNFGHPDPKRYGENFYTKTGEIVECDEVIGARIIELGRGEKVDGRTKADTSNVIKKEVEVVDVTEKDVPDIEEVTRKPRRKAGQKPPGVRGPGADQEE
jgi:hypothetical protein